MRGGRTLQLALVCLIGLIGAAPAHSTQTKGWYLRQTSDILGSFELRVSPIGTKFIWKEMTVIALPNNKVLVYNRSGKTYMAMTHKEFKQGFGGLSSGKVLSVSKGRAGTVAGRKAQQYIVNGKNSDGPWKREFWVTDEFGAPRQLSDLFCDLFELPCGYGQPLRFIYDHGGGRRVTEFDTVECKPITISGNEYKPMAGYRKAKNESEFFAQGGDSGLSSVFGVTETPTPPKRPSSDKMSKKTR